MTYRRCRPVAIPALATLLFGAPGWAAPQEEISATWRGIMDRAVVVTRTNTSSADEVWTNTLTPLAAPLPPPPLLVVDPVKKDKVIPKEAVSVRVLFDAKTALPPGADLRYLLTIDRARADGTKTVEQAVLHVRPVLPLPAMDDGRAYVLDASRKFPFTTPWTIENPIVLAAAPDPRAVSATTTSRIPVATENPTLGVPSAPSQLATTRSQNRRGALRDMLNAVSETTRR